MKNLTNAERSKAYYTTHKEELKAKNKAYREAHREEIKAYKAAKYQSEKEAIAAKNKEWREKNYAEYRAKREEYEKGEGIGGQRARLVYQHYGNKCQAPYCSSPNGFEGVWSMLDLHHLNIDGEKFRRETGIKTLPLFHKWLIDHDFPDDITLLCKNCHVMAHKAHRQGKPWPEAPTLTPVIMENTNEQS